MASSPSALTPSDALGLAPGQTIDAALKQPFDAAYEVTLSGPQKGTVTSLRNCLDYLQVENTIYSAGSALDFQTLRSDGARCDALDLLRTAKPAAQHSLSFRDLTVKDLPPGLSLLIAREEQTKADALAQRGGTILDMDPTIRLRLKGQDHAELVAQDWTANLTLYAHGDFLGNGSEQLLVRRDAAAKQGTYQSTTLFLLARTSPTGPLRIERQRP